ncbi:MAG: zf-HC2 domain-containing protein [Betaproteobacteria bacterium]
MNCALALLMLDAYIDDELDAATAAQMVEHLATCHECTELNAQRVAMRATFRATSLRHVAPRDLRKSIMRSIERPERQPTPSRTLRWWQAFMLAGSTAVMGALGGLWFAQPTALETLPQFAVARHVASLTPAGPRIDVASNDHHNVRPWFQGRVEFAPTVRDLSAQGFDLVGGRVEQIGDRQAAAVVYRLRSHIINVFSWRGRGNSVETARAMTIRGFNVITWSDRDLDFAAVSDADGAELRRFTAAYRGP